MIGDDFVAAMKEFYLAGPYTIIPPSLNIPEAKGYCEYCGTGPHAGQCPNCGAGRRMRYRAPIDAASLGATNICLYEPYDNEWVKSLRP